MGLRPSALKQSYDKTLGRLFMAQQNIDFIGGGFKLTLPYTFGGWFLWVLGLLITGFGVVAAMSDPVGLAVSVIGLVVLAMASPGSMSAGLHKMRKEAIAPEVLRAKAEEMQVGRRQQRPHCEGFQVPSR